MYLVCKTGLAVQAAVDDNGGQSLPSDIIIKKWYQNKHHADAQAKQLAAKYPGQIFAVFCVSNMFEAKQPVIMEKKMTETGEIVPV